MPRPRRDPGIGHPVGAQRRSRRTRPARPGTDGGAVPAQRGVPWLRDTTPHRHALHRLHRPEVPQLHRPAVGAVGVMSRDRQHEEVPRSEGDLRIYWDEDDGRIAEAWCQGTMYRGYEMILIGRYPEDALATTARLCGICSTSHVVAASHALEDAWNLTPPAQGVRPADRVRGGGIYSVRGAAGRTFLRAGLVPRFLSRPPPLPGDPRPLPPAFRGLAAGGGASLLEANPGRHHRFPPPMA